MRLAALIGAVVSTLALSVTAANATPSRGVTGTIISKTTFGGKDYIVREITLDPGGSTGWHYHRGTLFALVRAGTLTHTESDCTSTDVYPKGSAFTEPSGTDHVHIGRNLGKKPVVLEVLYVLPAGSPLSDDAPNPGCDFD
ncbi:quercetin dioxygenase-like cupin family protein [Kibdelosporangium banguiense]|uniref:Quercetin dioxygenase-like cupin family protein n=1 Tax=Kibdelosporangium banguiense TaxID=1365924 RepID=A0ABS4TZK4_9PSEU|nr:cupin domain-containing protein [Kibdelosporangium banguiense]MBP2329823.1 quercetin dioxygenase-like cupin family protein [Kibdelosporangium banguiense]